MVNGFVQWCLFSREGSILTTIDRLNGNGWFRMFAGFAIILIMWSHRCVLCDQMYFMPPKNLLYTFRVCVWVRSTQLTTRGLNTNIHQLHRFTNFVLALIQSNSVLSKTAALYQTFALNYDSCNLFVFNDWNVYVHIKINIGLKVSHTYNYVHTYREKETDNMKCLRKY